MGSFMVRESFMINQNRLRSMEIGKIVILLTVIEIDVIQNPCEIVYLE
jgi:hypothetical protein